MMAKRARRASPGVRRRDETGDLERSMALLGGFYKKGWHRYLASEEEEMGRAAIVRLLLGEHPLDRSLRVMLAALFNPDPTHDPVPLDGEDRVLMALTAERMLRFGFRSKKRRSQPSHPFAEGRKRSRVRKGKRIGA
jgi:hypothetical protein